LRKDATDDVHGPISELKEKIDSVIDTFKAEKNAILEEFDSCNKTIRELQLFSARLEKCFGASIEELVKLGLGIDKIANDAELLAGALDCLSIPEPEYDEDDIERLERVDDAAALYIRSRLGGKFEEGIDFDELVRAVEGRP